MIYEFIATISAGFGMAGLALIIRHLSKLAGKTAPKWLIPIFAGIGMLGFQIHQEYHWHEQQLKLLPTNTKTVSIIKQKIWYRPWSYLYPQVIRVMAVSDIATINQENIHTPQPLPSTTQTTQPNMLKDDIKTVHIYLLERRMSTKVIQQQINCTNLTYVIMAQSANVSVPAVAQPKTWHKMDKNSKLFQTVCHQ